MVGLEMILPMEEDEGEVYTTSEDDVQRAILEPKACEWDMATYDPNQKEELVIDINHFIHDYKKKQDEGKHLET